MKHYIEIDLETATEFQESIHTEILLLTLFTFKTRCDQGHKKNSMVIKMDGKEITNYPL